MFHPANLVRLAVVASILLGSASVVGVRAQETEETAVRVRVIRSVVQIMAWVVATENGQSMDELIPRGSGSVVSPDGLVLTNYHVIDRTELQAALTAEEANFKLQGRDRTFEIRDDFVLLQSEPNEPPVRKYTARIVPEGVDPVIDLAVLRISGGSSGQPITMDNLTFLELGDSDTVDAYAEPIFVAGYPGKGLIKYQSATLSGPDILPGVVGWAWFFTTATLSNGMSGGAAVDEDGRLIGVPTRAGEIDCRPGDTNGDGSIDDSDVGCVPSGGAFNQLRPINHAKPLLEKAGLRPTATVGPTPTSTVSPSATLSETPTSTATVQLTATPTETPTLQPTETPTEEPTATPTQEPTTTPTLEPTETPTLEPTEAATIEPTETSTLEPTATPTVEPKVLPTPIDTGPAVMYLGNPAHTGNPDAVGPEGEPERLWRVKTGYRPRSAPAVAAGTVYVGGDAGLFALDAATGEERWLFETAEEISASPAVIDGVVYVGGADGIFYAVDAGTGMERWQFKTGGKIRASAAIANGVIYFTSFDGYIYALDIASGTELWRYETELDDLTSSPAVADGVIYFGGGRIEGGSVYALDVSTRKSRWKDPVRVAGTVGSSPMVLDGFVYVGSDVGTLYGIDAESGEIVCRFDTGRLVRSSPSTYEGMILIGNRKQSLFALAGGGNCDSLVWEFKVRDWIDSPPTVAGDTIYFGSLDNILYALDSVSRQIRWQYETGGGILTSPAVADGVVYFTSRDGYVYALTES